MTEEKSLEEMTVKELREVAKEIPEITGTSSLKKDELLSRIKEAKGGSSDSPAPKKKAPKPKKKSAKGVSRKDLSVKDIKNLIVKLRKDKVDVKGDRDAVSRLRRQINILKKRTRKVVQV